MVTISALCVVHRFSGDAIDLCLPPWFFGDPPRGHARTSLCSLAGRSEHRWLNVPGGGFRGAQRAGRGVRERLGGAGHILDHDVADLEHTLEIERARGAYGLTQRIVTRHHSTACRLTMVPFRPVARAVGTHDAVLGGDLVPQLR